MASDGSKKRLSKWWPLGFLIGAIVFFAIGGGLLGAWTNSVVDNCSNNFGYSGYSGYSGLYCATTSNMGLWDAGIAMFVIGALLKFTFWVLLIIYCVQRRRVTYNYNYNVNANPGAPQNIPMHLANVPPINPPTQEFGGGKFCGQCGTPSTGSFCTQCGTHI